MFTTNLKKPFINAFLLLITLIFNGMGASGIINSLSQKEISDMYRTLITPTPETFSIWSVIYLLLIISVILPMAKNIDPYYKTAIDKISYLFWASCFCNILWIIFFSYNLIGLSVITIITFLTIMFLLLIEIRKINNKKHWLLPITFGLYSGWLFIATILNIELWLVKINWTRFGINQEIWSSILITIAVLSTIIILRKTENPIFPIPIAWGYYGIYKSLSNTEIFQQNYIILKNSVLIGIVILTGLSLISIYTTHNKSKQHN